LTHQQKQIIHPLSKKRTNPNFPIYRKRTKKEVKQSLTRNPFKLIYFGQEQKRKLNPKSTLSEIDYIINRVGKIRNKLFKREEVY